MSIDSNCLLLEHKQLLKNAQLELKKSKRKDYYKILGVDKNASEDEIKKAYRKRALMHHPGRADAGNGLGKRKPGQPCQSQARMKGSGFSAGKELLLSPYPPSFGSVPDSKVRHKVVSVLNCFLVILSSSHTLPFRSAQWSQCRSSEGGGEEVQGSWRSFYHPL